MEAQELPSPGLPPPRQRLLALATQAAAADTAPIVLADGEPELCDALRSELTADGYAVASAPSARALVLVLRSTPAALVLLGDFGVPGDTALLLRDMRAGTGDFLGLPTIDDPIIVLARDVSLLSTLRCFDAGADDVVHRTVDYLELRARVRAVLARADALPRERLRVGDLIVDLAGAGAAWRGVPLDLTPMEFALLAHLARDPTRLFTKAELLRDVWAYRSFGHTRTVDAHASRLRRKLAAAGAQGLVVNRRGTGYALAHSAATRDTR